MKKIILPLVAVVLLTQGCLRDTGNYVYRDINELQFVGIRLGANAAVDTIVGRTLANPILVEDIQQALFVSPVINTSMDTEDNLRFEWIDDSAGIRVAVSHSRDLVDFRAPARWIGSRSITFRIEDTVSRKILDTRVFFNVVNPFQAGWAVLQEDNAGYTRLDMISWLPGVEYRQFADVLTGFPRQRGARQIRVFHDGIMSAAFGGTAVYIVTDDYDVYRINRSTFEWVGEEGHLRNAFLSPTFFPENTRVSSFPRGGSGHAMLNMDGSLFYFNQTVNQFFSVELNITEDRERFRASPHISYRVMEFLIFDEDSQSFYFMHPHNQRWARRIMTTDTIVSFRNMGMDLVFSESGRIGGGGVQNRVDWSYNVLKDADGDFWVLVVSMGGWGQQFWRRMTDPSANPPAGFNENSLMAVGGEFVNRQMYVAVGRHIFRYDVQVGSFAQILELPPTETITFMGFTRDDLLTVASFCSATNVGTVANYEIPTAVSPLTIYQDTRTGQLHRWTGFGRIGYILRLN